MQPGIQIPESFRSSQTESATATEIGGWEGARTLNKGMLLHRGDVCGTSRKKKKSRETAESKSRIGPAFYRLLRRRFLGHEIPSHVLTKTSRRDVLDLRYSFDR